MNHRFAVVPLISSLLLLSACGSEEETRSRKRAVRPDPEEIASRDGESEGKIYEVGGDVVAPVPIYQAEPVYPNEGLDLMRGSVMVKMVVMSDGTVANVEIEHGQRNEYTDAVLDAVGQWTFNPATRNGEPVDVNYYITIPDVPTDLAAP